MFCPGCGTSAKDTAAFCPKCGASLRGGSERGDWQTPANTGAAHAAGAAAPAESPKKKGPHPAVLIALIALVAAGMIVGAVLLLSGRGGASEPVHRVSFTVKAEGYSNDSATRIPVQVTGASAKGASVDEVHYIDAAGEGLYLPEGDYTLSFPASPLCESGSLYSVPADSIAVSVSPDHYDSGADAGNPSTADTDGAKVAEALAADEARTVSMTALSAADAGEEALQSAYTYAQQDPAASTDKVDEYYSATQTAIEQGPAAYDKAMAAYADIVANAGSYDYGETGGFDVMAYRYALVNMQAGDEVPTLLLEQQNSSGVADVRVFAFDPASGSIVSPEDTLQEGVAGVGGFRGGISTMDDGNGLCMTVVSAGNGAMEITRVTRDGSSLVNTSEFSGRLGDQTPDSCAASEITWYDASDTSALGVSGSSASSAGTAPAQRQQEAATPTDGDRPVLSGTVMVCDLQQIEELQGVRNPNPSSVVSTWVIVKLDEPCDVTAQEGSGQGYKTANAWCMKLGNDYDGGEQYEAMLGYDGQHITFSYDPEKSWFPSDTSLPIGQPSAGDVHILG